MTKRKYINPKIEEIRLDNEISLQLASEPTIDPRLEEEFEAVNGGENATEAYTYENW